MKVVNYDIVFQEVPGETSLALNLSGCPFRCEGCHSPQLREDIGVVLSAELIDSIINKYRDNISCVCFMGGDAYRDDVLYHAGRIKSLFGLKTAWYSGSNVESVRLSKLKGCLDFAKFGPFVKNLGGLKSKSTNQRFFAFDSNNNRWNDITYKFWN